MNFTLILRYDNTDHKVMDLGADTHESPVASLTMQDLSKLLGRYTTPKDDRVRNMANGYIAEAIADHRSSDGYDEAYDDEGYCEDVMDWMRGDCIRFAARNPKIFDDLEELTAYRIGQLFYLSRNGAGYGFWDESEKRGKWYEARARESFGEWSLLGHC